MPHYFFDIDVEDHLQVDDEGLTLPDVEAARYEALAVLPNITREALRDGSGRTYISSVRNSTGEIIYRITLSLQAEWVAGERPSLADEATSDDGVSPGGKSPDLA